MARTILDPTYKKHLNGYNGAGDTAEFLLNSESVQTLLKGNDTMLDNIQKALMNAGMESAGILNGKDLIRKVGLTLKERTQEKKLDSFLNSLKSALQDIDQANNQGMYFQIDFCYLVHNFVHILEELSSNNKVSIFFTIFHSVEDGFQKKQFCECSSDAECINSHDMNICGKCDLETGSCLTANYDKTGNCLLEKSKLSPKFVKKFHV